MKRAEAVFSDWTGSLATAIALAYLVSLATGIHFNRGTLLDTKTEAVPVFAAIAALLTAASVLLSFRAPLKISVAARRQGSWRPGLAGVVHAVILLAASRFLNTLDLEWTAFREHGRLLLHFTLVRAVFVFELIVLFQCAGALVIDRFLPKASRQPIDDPLGHLLLTTGVGACSLALLVSLLGVFGLIKLSLLMPLCLVILVASDEPSRRRFAAVARGLRLRVRAEGRAASTIFVAALFAAWYATTALFALKGFYPLTDGDVWEHYLHYYREVISTGSIGPGEVWYHFLLSKGAGLFFLAGTISHVFSVTLVSLALILLAGALVFHLVDHLTGDAAWAVMGILVFFCSVMADDSIGAFFKHHAVLTWLQFFILWGLHQRTIEPKARPAQALALGIAGFYLGFYQPVASALSVSSLGLFWLFAGLSRDRRRLQRIALAPGVCIFAGIFVSLALNYFELGLVEIMPANLFWKLADQARFRRVVSDGPMALFLFMKNDQAGSMNLNGDWLLSIFRAGFFRHLSPALPVACGALALVFALSRRNRKPRVTPAAMPRLSESPRARLLAVLACFLAGSAIIGQLAQVGSTSRLFLVTLPMTTVLVVAMGRLICHSVPRALRTPASVAALFALAWIPVSGAIWYSADVALYFLDGRHSFEDTLRHQGNGSHESHRLFDFMSSSALATGKREARFLTLGYLPNAAYSVPGRGWASEPSYSLGPDFMSKVYGPGPELAKFLSDKGFRFFHISTRSPTFSSMAFSEVFQAGNLESYFQLAAESEGEYILAWRRPETTTALPESLKRILDLRQSGTLDGLVRKAWRKPLLAAMGGRSGRDQLDASLTRELTRLGAGKMSVESDRVWFTGLISASIAAVRASRPAAAGEELVTALIDNLRALTSSQIGSAYGEGVRSANFDSDPLWPYGPIYRDPARFHEILEGRVDSSNVGRVD